MEGRIGVLIGFLLWIPIVAAIGNWDKLHIALKVLVVALVAGMFAFVMLF
jgi:hypothetical protein